MSLLGSELIAPSLLHKRLCRRYDKVLVQIVC